MPYQLQISARLLQWPRACVCCCGTPDTQFRAAASRTTGTRVQRTNTSWWDVPYCSACAQHAHAFATATRSISAGLIVGLLAFIILTASERPTAGIVVGVAIAIIGVALSRAARMRARAAMLQTCAAETQAIRYVEWYGTLHTFVFASRQYLDAFIAANDRKTMSDVRVV